MWNFTFFDIISFGMALRTTSSITPSVRAFRPTSSECWVEQTTVVTSRGRPSTYRTVTWLFPSGRSQGSALFSRASVSLAQILWA